MNRLARLTRLKRAPIASAVGCESCISPVKKRLFGCEKGLKRRKGLKNADAKYIVPAKGCALSAFRLPISAFVPLVAKLALALCLVTSALAYNYNPDALIKDTDVKLYRYASGAWKLLTKADKDLYTNSNIVILSHGWRSEADDMLDIAAKIKSSGNEVLCVHWKHYAETNVVLTVALGEYYAKEAAKEIPYVANLAVNGLEDLGLTGKNYTFIGHSHGAHVTGKMANKMGAALHIGLDTSPKAAHKTTASVFTPNKNSITKTIFFKTSEKCSMETAYADENYIISQPNDFVLDTSKKFADAWAGFWRDESRHAFSRVWFSGNFNSTTLDLLKVKTYWLLKNGNDDKFAFSCSNNYFWGVINNSSDFDATAQFFKPAPSINEYKPVAGKTWKAVCDNLKKSIDLVAKPVPVTDWKTGEKQKSFVLSIEDISDTTTLKDELKEKAKSVLSATMSIYILRPIAQDGIAPTSDTWNDSKKYQKSKISETNGKRTLAILDSVLYLKQYNFELNNLEIPPNPFGNSYNGKIYIVTEVTAPKALELYAKDNVAIVEGNLTDFVGTYTGVLYDAADTISGTWKLTSNNKGKLTAQIVTTDATGKVVKYAFAGDSWDPIDPAKPHIYTAQMSILDKKTKLPTHTLEVSIDTNLPWDTMNVEGKFSYGQTVASALDLAGQRNAFLDKPIKPATTTPALTYLAPYIGDWVAIYNEAEQTWTTQKRKLASKEVPVGKYLTLKVSTGGAISYVSKSPTVGDKTFSYSGATTLLNDEGAALVPLFKIALVKGIPFSEGDLVELQFNPVLYMVVDLSGGPNATSYPVSYLNAKPAGGWSNEYKTNKLVLRRIEAGTFMMGLSSGESLHQVTLTQGFYIGVFEVTQRQWELVMGTKPSYFSNASYYTTRPVECVSYNDIRGSSLGVGWPGNNNVDSDSFMGKFRSKTGQVFDLPTEAQWEYACRAGTTTDLNSGKNLTDTYTCPNMAEVGRYWYNGGSSGYTSNGTTAVGAAAVGSYLSNAWGLYDMHGNVWEWCLDWYVANLGTASVTDPKGAASISYRLNRGGAWAYYAGSCRSADRYLCTPSYSNNNIGFRASLTLP